MGLVARRAPQPQERHPLLRRQPDEVRRDAPRDRGPHRGPGDEPGATHRVGAEQLFPAATRPGQREAQGGRRRLRDGHPPGRSPVDDPPLSLVGPAGRRGSLRAVPLRADAEFFGTVAVAKLLPTFANRQQIRAGVLGAFRGESPQGRVHIPVLWRNWRTNGGAQLNPRNPAFRDPYAETPAAPGSGTWRPDPVNAEYLEKFLDLAGSRGIPVYWLLPPFTPGLQRIHDQIGDAPAYRRYAREALARHPNLVVVDAQHSGYEANLFIDPVHLDRQGAAVLSMDLAEVVATHPAAGPPESRWVALPAYQERPAAVPLEDTGESFLALRTRETGRRR